MSSSSRVVNQHEQMDAKKKKIWELATSPRREMMMMMFMMWVCVLNLICTATGNILLLRIDFFFQ